MSRRWLAGGIGFLAWIVVVVAAQAASVNLVWDTYVQNPPPGIQATQFVVYRQAGTAAPVKVATVPVAQPMYSDAAVVTGQTYTWTVTALAATGEESPPSNAVTFRVPFNPPATPTGLRGVIVP